MLCLVRVSVLFTVALGGRFPDVSGNVVSSADSKSFISSSLGNIYNPDQFFLPSLHGAAVSSARQKRVSTVFRSENCYKQDEDGICYGEVTCRHLRGKVAGFCSGLQGACCVFYRTCGGRTAQKVSHFRNQAWPLKEHLQETCSFSVTKHDQSICGLRVTIDTLKLPGRVGFCSDTFLWISGIPKKNLELICGHFSGISYQFNMTTTNEIYLKLKSFSGFKSSWRMTVRQMTCEEFKFEVLPYVGDGATAMLAPIPETQKPYISTTTTSPNDFGRCGVKGTPTLRNTTSSKASKMGMLADLIWSTRNGIETLEEMSGESSENSEDDRTAYRSDFARSEISLEWKAPNLNDSIFFQNLGPPGVVLGQRITYGEVAEIGEFPWQAALFSNSNFHCGGSIISDRHVLTAAHCVVSFINYTKPLRVILGVWNVKNADKEQAETVLVDRVTPHSEYSKFTLQNDIAVLKLSKEITFNEKIRPICLPERELELDGKLAYVTGWGRDQRRRLVTKLHKLQAAIVSNEVCDERWMQSGAQHGFITPSMMCMDAQDGDSCNGDSGGPTVIENPNANSQFVQVGIVSFGSGSCTDKRLPGVYTKVTSFLDWITHATNE